MASRVRPARLPRWRGYVPGAAIALFSLIVAFPPSLVTANLAAIGLGTTGTRVLLGAGVVAVAVVAAALANRPPVAALIVGATALSIGGNLLVGPWIGAPLILAGLGWIGVVETRRWFDGITLSPRGLTLHRALRSPFTVDFDDVRAVHTTMHTETAGTLILETEHGTVTAPHLPGCEALQARIEARMRQVPVRAQEDSLAKARQRLEGLLEGAASP